MPQEHAPRDREPAPGQDAEGAGSLVIGVDPAAPDGFVAGRYLQDRSCDVRVLELSVDSEQLQAYMAGMVKGFAQMRDNLARSAPAINRSMAELGEALRENRERIRIAYGSTPCWTPTTPCGGPLRPTERR